MEIMKVFKQLFEGKRKGDSMSYVGKDGKESSSLLHWEVEQDIPDLPSEKKKVFDYWISQGADEELARRMSE